MDQQCVCVFVSVWSIGLALPTCLVYCYHDNPYIAPSQHHMVAMVTSPPFLAVSMSQVYLPAGNDRWMVGVSVYVCFSFRGDKPRTQSLQKRQISKEPSRSLRVY